MTIHQIAPDYAQPEPPEELAAKGEVGKRESRIFRRLAVSRMDIGRKDEIGTEAFRRHLTVQTHVGGFAHAVMAHALSKP